MEIQIDFGKDGIKVKALLSKDGNRWCVLLGDDLQIGIAGFGNSVFQAITDFKSNFRNS